MISEIPESALSRGDLLGWINDILKLNLTKIEQLGTGAVHCQLLDIIYPGKVPLHKVNWRAKFEYEFVYNFKILQQSFTKQNIPKYIDVEKLIKAKYQDNLEFAQWMKKYFLATCTTKDYDPVARRGNIEPDFTFLDKSSTIKGPKESVTKNIVTAKLKTIPAPKNVILKGDSLNTSKHADNISNSESSSNLFASLSNKENDLLNDIKNTMERHKNERHNPQLEILRSERDFYYSKLKDIDHVLDVYKDTNVETLINNIREILYLLPEKVAIVLEDGNLQIQTKSDHFIGNDGQILHVQGNNEPSDEHLESFKNIENSSAMEEENLLSN